MNLKLNVSLAENYSSNSQIARVLTESWVTENISCPRCGEFPLSKFENNKPVADFHCSNCKEQFELKSTKGRFSNKVNDGAYSTMIDRITSSQNPNFFLLNYSDTYTVNNLIIVPKHFFTPDAIIARKPLSSTAKRAGWIGCSIDISQIVEPGKVFLIHNTTIIDCKIVQNSFNNLLFLREKSFETRGWLLDVLKCLESIKSEIFTLDEVYSFEVGLGLKHPKNKHIKPKIRQQLQFLRDKGVLEFIGKGNYRKLF